jgi:WD40 repeat protein
MFIINQHYYCILKGKHISFYIFLSFLFLSFTGCNQNQADKDLSSPPEYNLNSPAVIKLPGYLDEISGIAFYPKDKTVFAISDEKGWLYKIFLSGKMTPQKWNFAKKDDFEDVVLVDSTFYILNSNGDLLSLRFYSYDSIVLKEYPSPLPGKNEFEILYLDKEQNRLILLCKNCASDDNNSLSSWGFDLAALTFSSSPVYVIDIRKIESLMQEKKVRFKPSAAAIHPLTGRLFIISAINKVLVVAEPNGNPEKIYRINPRLYKQPEGLTFTPEGHLLISNESKDIGAANILIFKYNQGK